MISNPSSTEHKFVILRGRTERVTFTVFHTVRDSSVHMDSLAEIVKNCHRDLRAAVKRECDRDPTDARVLQNFLCRR